MKRIFAIGAIVVVAVMTAVVGFRLSTDALSIIVGAILGMAAIVPTLLLGGYLLKKNQETVAAAGPTQSYQPPVVVVSGGMMPPHYAQPHQQTQPQMPALMPPPAPSAPRKFHLMGYEETEQQEYAEDTWARR
jgi:hypothetical protein